MAEMCVFYKIFMQLCCGQKFLSIPMNIGLVWLWLDFVQVPAPELALASPRYLTSRSGVALELT